jgi:hypothetical protein
MAGGAYMWAERGFAEINADVGSIVPISDNSDSEDP